MNSTLEAGVIEINSSDYTITIHSEIIELEEKWRKLVEGNTEYTIFQSFEWNQLWLVYLLKPSSKPYIIEVSCQGSTIAIFPLTINVIFFKNIKLKQVSMIGFPQFDYSKFLILPGHKKACVSLLFDWLHHHQEEWDILLLPNFEENDDVSKLIGKLSAEHLFTVETEYMKCYGVTLEEDFEAYQNRLGKNSRNKYSRCLNRLNEYGDYSVVKGDASQIHHFFELHSKKWNSVGETGIFTDNNIRSFHEALAQRLHDSLDLYFLCVRDEPIAAIYSYNFGGKRYFYLSGMDTEYEKLSPGIYLLLHRLKDSFEQGLEYFDMLRGAQRYKQQFANSVKLTQSFIIAHDEQLLKELLFQEVRLRTKGVSFGIQKLLKETEYEAPSILKFPERKMKILILTPHFDDEIIGSGGVLAHHIERGDVCDILYLTNGSASEMSRIHPDRLTEERKKEAIEAQKHIGNFNAHYLDINDGFLSAKKEIINSIRELVSIHSYDRIYFPPSYDRHSDHRMAAIILRQMLLHFEFEGELCIYEVLTPLKNPNRYFILDRHQEQKLAALNCHTTQMRFLNYVQLVSMINSYRGKQLSFSSPVEAYKMISKHELMHGF